MPVGPNTLWPEKTKKSQSIDCTSTGMCETDCAPSTSTRAPWRCAIAVISRTGVTVPSALETCVIETMRVLRIEQLFIFLENDLAAIVDRRDAQPGAGLGAEHLPGHDIGVMLEPGDDDLVALSHIAAAPGLGDEIDALGRAAHEDDVLDRRRLQEAANFFARGFIGVGRARRQRMGGAVDVGILIFVEMRQTVDDRLRLLRRRGVVEPDQRLAMHLLLQDREVALDAIGIEGFASGVSELASSCGS